MRIKIDFTKMPVEGIMDRYKTCIEVMKRHQIQLNQSEKLLFINDLESHLPIKFEEISDNSIHVKPIIKALNRYFLFCDDADGVVCTSKSKSIQNKKYRVTELLNIPPLEGGENDGKKEKN